MSARRLLLASVPFPRVKGTKTQAAALDRAVRDLPLTPFPPMLTRPGERRVSAEAQRGVLSVIADHANGAGFAFLLVATIAHESGWDKRTVQRALAALEAQELIERYRLMRSRDRYSPSLPQRARQGEGPSVYRLGRVLRAAAGLAEVDWSPASWSPSQDVTTPPCHPRDASQEERGRVTAGTTPVSPPNEQELSASEGFARVTPRTENGKPLIEEAGFIPSRTEGAEETDDDRFLAAIGQTNGKREDESLAAAIERARRTQALCPVPDAIVWPDTSRLSNEKAILCDCEKLVELGFAEWIGGDGEEM